MTKLAKPQMRSDYPPEARKKSSSSVLTSKDAYARLRAWLTKTKGQKTMAKNNKTNEGAAPTKAAKKNGKKGNGIIGMLLLLVVISVAYSTYVVWFGTTGLAPKIMLAPQMLFVAAALLYSFWKATK